MRYTMYIYKTDRRCRSGERLVSITVWDRRDVESMDREVRELVLFGLYPAGEYRIEYQPAHEE